jgi:hypothetical protein
MPDQHAAVGVEQRDSDIGTVGFFSAHAWISRRHFRRCIRAFSSEVDTGSRPENASKQKLEPRSDSIATELALASTWNGDLN